MKGTAGIRAAKPQTKRSSGIRHTVADTTTSVGRIGTLEFEYALRDGRTALLHAFCSSPWHFLPPSELDEGRAAYTFLVNPSGGLVGGDHLSIRATVGAGAHVLFSTPSANRIYRSGTVPARQTMHLDVGPDAVVEWVPESAIPYGGSRYAQTFEITVERGGVLWFWEVLASGRMARGERWAFTEFSSSIRISTAAGARIVERMVVEPGGSGGGVGLAGDWDYIASAFLVSDRVDDVTLREIRDRSAAAMDSVGAEVLGGNSRPAAQGLAVKLVAKTGESLKQALDRVWEIVRRSVLHLPLPSLRKY